MAKLNFEIEKHIATLGTNAKGWSKELNLVSWNGRDAKYDIREWDEDHENMGKGVTLSKDEYDKLVKALSSTPVSDTSEAAEVPQQSNEEQVDLFATDD